MKFHHRAVPIVLSVALIDAIGFGIVMPVLPRLVIELTQLSLPEATKIGGLLGAAYALSQFFAGPILGNLGDSIGRRPVLLFSTIAFALDYALCAAAPTIGWLFLGRVVAGIAGATFGPANAVLADVTPPEKRGQTFGLMGAAFGTGFIVGPVIGGLVAEMGHRVPFLVAGGLAAINAIWILVALPETMARENRRKFDIRQAHVIGSFRPLLNAGGATFLLLAMLFWQFAHMVYPATWAFWGVIAMGWNEQQISYTLAASGVGMIVVQTMILGRMLKRFGEARTAVIGVFFGMAVFVGYVFAREAWMIAVLLGIGALQAMAYPSMNGLLSRMTDPSRQGALQGGVASMVSLNMILAPLVMTYILAEGTKRGFTGGNFALAAVLAALALIILMVKVVPKVKTEASA